MWFLASPSLGMADFVDMSAFVVGQDQRHGHESIGFWLTDVNVLVVVANPFAASHS
jgi:hypothetical protein